MRRRGPSGLRAAILLTAGEFALHELRYLLAYGSRSGSALHQQGHDYLGVLTPLLAGLLALSLAGSVMRLAGPRHARSAGGRAIGWLGTSAVLLLIFCAQESVEGLLAAGHPAGPAALLANAGWVALPLALVLGAVIAALLHPALVERALASVQLAMAPPRAEGAHCAAFLQAPRPALAGIAPARGPPQVLR